MDRRSFATFLSLDDKDLLQLERFKLIGLGKLAEAILGQAFCTNNMACNPTSPASLGINITACELYQLLNVDATPYGVLPADSTPLVKQGINTAVTALTLTAPSTVGNSVNYLIQAQVLETDTDSATRDFKNANGDEYTQAINQDRVDTVNLVLKAGTSAPTGTQSTPTPDTGFCGCFVVTVDNGQTQIISSDIARYTGTGAVIFLDEKLKDKLSQAAADLRYGRLTVGNTWTQPQTMPVRAASATMTTFQSLPDDGTVTPVDLDATALVDTDTFWDGVNKRMDLKYPGLYRISAILYSDNPPSGDFNISVFSSETSTYRRIAQSTTSGADVTLSGSTLIESDGTGYAKLFAAASTSAAFNIGGTSGVNSYFEIEYLGTLPS